MNYGPWDRLHEDEPFVEGVGRAAGRAVLPGDMTKAEFELSAADKDSHYTLIRRDEGGKLVSVPYHEAYKAELEPVAALLREAAELSEDKSFAKYLEMRAKALLDDDYQPSDLAWMDMKTNPVDVVIGPIEYYDDGVFGVKASYEGLVLVKDQAWSQRLARFTKFLPELQKNLPVDAKYKAEKPGAKADLNAYFALYYGGNATRAPRPSRSTCPNDEEVQLQKGSRRLQLENVMQAKFEKILVPVAKQVIADDQVAHVQFDAFFQNTMFHEVAHGPRHQEHARRQGTGARRAQGPDLELRGGQGRHPRALHGHAARAEGRARQGQAHGQLRDLHRRHHPLGALRRERRARQGQHGVLQLLPRPRRLRARRDGKYRVDFDKTQKAMEALSAKILTLQGDGDYDGAQKLNDEMGVIRPELQAELGRPGQGGHPDRRDVRAGPRSAGPDGRRRLTRETARATYQFGSRRGMSVERGLPRCSPRDPSRASPALQEGAQPAPGRVSRMPGLAGEGG
jgi:hypothetical protein